MSIATADALMGIFGYRRLILKPRKCAQCRQVFTPSLKGQKVCGVECAKTIAKNRRLKAERQADKIKLESLKTARDYLKPAQDAFNAFIRERDLHLPCICCGKHPDGDDWTPGGTWDAGHFLSRGSHPELRFEEMNCHKQLKTCNGGSSKYARKGRTVSEGYRRNLIEKIGIGNVEWLEGPHGPKKYTIDDLKAIAKEYKAKTKELRNVR